MKKIILKKTFLSIVILTFVLITSSNLYALKITTVHGHSGHIEYEDRLLSDRHYLGWGLQFSQSPSGPNWVHYSIPIDIPAKSRYVALVFSTENVNVGITTIDVFDGRTRIHREADLDLYGPYQAYILDMGEEKTIGLSLGISIEVEAGVESGNQVIIDTVAAIWEPSIP